MIAILAHEWRQARAGGGGTLAALLFLFAVVTVAAFAIGADIVALARNGPAVVWIAALLAALLGAERAIGDDIADGTLDTIRMAGVESAAYAGAKIIARWLFVLVPLAAAAPLAGLLLAMPGPAIFGTSVTLALGSPAMAALAILGSALSAATRGSAILGAVVALPLLVPVVVFGSAAAAVWGTADAVTPTLFLIAASLVACTIAPFAIAALVTTES